MENRNDNNEKKSDFREEKRVFSSYYEEHLNVLNAQNCLLCTQVVIVPAMISEELKLEDNSRGHKKINEDTNRTDTSIERKEQKTENLG